jgi:hypothetical protein
MFAVPTFAVSDGVRTLRSWPSPSTPSRESPDVVVPSSSV